MDFNNKSYLWEKIRVVSESIIANHACASLVRGYFFLVLYQPQNPLKYYTSKISRYKVRITITTTEYTDFCVESTPPGYL